jgi:hypothetical protein
VLTITIEPHNYELLPLDMWDWKDNEMALEDLEYPPIEGLKSNSIWNEN